MRYLTTAVLLLSTTLLAAADVTPPNVMNVNCDAGDDLAKALAKAPELGVDTIRVQGTCTGHFTVAGPGLALRPVPGVPRPSLVGDEEQLPVLETSHSLVVEGLLIRGGLVGLRAQGPDTAVALLESEIRESVIGLVVDRGAHAYVPDCMFEDNQIGIIVQRGATSSIQRTSVQDNEQEGLIAFDGSRIALFKSNVAGNGSVGLLVTLHSSANLGDSTFFGNGEAHVFAQGRSDLNVTSGVTFGGPTDTTLFSAGVDDNSSLSSHSAATFYGSILASRASYVGLGDIEVHGALFVDDFSKAVLRRTAVDEGISCETGGDASCVNTTLYNTGCPTAPATCGSGAPSAGTAAPPAHPHPELRVRASFTFGLDPLPPPVAAPPRERKPVTRQAPAEAGSEKRALAPAR